MAIQNSNGRENNDWIIPLIVFILIVILIAVMPGFLTDVSGTFLKIGNLSFTAAVAGLVIWGVSNFIQTLPKLGKLIIGSVIVTAAVAMVTQGANIKSEFAIISTLIVLAALLTICVIFYIIKLAFDAHAILGVIVLIMATAFSIFAGYVIMILCWMMTYSNYSG